MEGMSVQGGKEEEDRDGEETRQDSPHRSKEERDGTVEFNDVYNCLCLNFVEKGLIWDIKHWITDICKSWPKSCLSRGFIKGGEEEREGEAREKKGKWARMEHPSSSSLPLLHHCILQHTQEKRVERRKRQMFQSPFFFPASPFRGEEEEEGEGEGDLMFSEIYSRIAAAAAAAPDRILPSTVLYTSRDTGSPSHFFLCAAASFFHFPFSSFFLFLVRKGI